jgi:hypothetical protein
VVDYVLLGKRRLEWRADLEEAKEAPREACRKIADGEHMALELSNGDRMIYLRASEALAPLNVALDTASHEYAEVLRILDGGWQGLAGIFHGHALRGQFAQFLIDQGSNSLAAPGSPCLMDSRMWVTPLMRWVSVGKD